MKNLLLLGLLFMFAFPLTACEKAEPAPEGEVDINVDYDEIDLDLAVDDDSDSTCAVTYGSMIVKENFDAVDREWKGNHDLGPGEVPTRMLFSADGNIKMYTDILNEGNWELVKNYNVDRMKVKTDDENIDDIIEFPKAVDYCLLDSTKENDDFPVCITLYAEGSPIAESPFNLKACLLGPNVLNVKRLTKEFTFND